MSTKVNFLFLVHSKGMLSSLRLIIYLLDNKNTQVFFLCHDRYSDSIDPQEGGDLVYSYVSRYYSNASCYIFEKDNLESFDFIANFFAKNSIDYVIRQTPWEGSYPSSLSSINLSKLALLVTIPYASVLTQRWIPFNDSPLNAPSHTYAQLYHQLSTRIYPDTLYSFQKYASFHGTEKVRFFGEDWCANLQHSSPSAVSITSDHGATIPFTDERPLITWTPHHSVTNFWLGFSTFMDIYEHIDFLRAKYTQYRFVLKPHPALFKALLERFWSSQQLADFIQSWNTDNSFLYTGPDSSFLFACSALILNDSISFIRDALISPGRKIFLDSHPVTI